MTQGGCTMRYTGYPRTSKDQAETRPGGEAQEQPARGTGRTLSRRTMLRQSGAGAAGAIVAGALGAGTGGHAAMARAPAPRHRATSGTDPQPQDAIVGLLGAMERFPLVGLGERHGIQETY